MTNNEWLNGLDVEEKAELLGNVAELCFLCGIQSTDKDKVKMECLTVKKGYGCLCCIKCIDWLKSEHKE